MCSGMREAISSKELEAGKPPFQSATGQDRAGVEQQSLQSLAEVPGSQTETLASNNTRRVFTYPLNLLWKREDEEDDGTWYCSAAEFSRGVCLA